MLTALAVCAWERDQATATSGEVRMTVADTINIVLAGIAGIALVANVVVVFETHRLISETAKVASAASQAVNEMQTDRQFEHMPYVVFTEVQGTKMLYNIGSGPALRCYNFRMNFDTASGKFFRTPGISLSSGDKSHINWQDLPAGHGAAIRVLGGNPEPGTKTQMERVVCEDIFGNRHLFREDGMLHDIWHKDETLVPDWAQPWWT